MEAGRFIGLIDRSQILGSSSETDFGLSVVSTGSSYRRYKASCRMWNFGPNDTKSWEKVTTMAEWIVRDACILVMSSVFDLRDSPKTCNDLPATCNLFNRNHIYFYFLFFLRQLGHLLEVFTLTVCLGHLQEVFTQGSFILFFVFFMFFFFPFFLSLSFFLNFFMM